MTPCLRLRSPSSWLTVAGGASISALDGERARTASVYLSVLSQRSFNSGLPVSISTAPAGHAASEQVEKHARRQRARSAFVQTADRMMQTAHRLANAIARASEHASASGRNFS